VAAAMILATTAVVGAHAQAVTLPSIPTANVKDLGALGNGVADDTAAIQKANDAVAAKGGGRVLFPAGTYIAADVRQDSNVEFVGMTGATLKHPDGVRNVPIVGGRFVRTTGWITAGSSQLVVLSPKGIRPGAIVAVRAAGGGSTVQSSPSLTAIAAAATQLTLAQAKGWSKSGSNFAQVEGEVVSYSGQSGTTLLNVKRGQFGTVPAAHPLGAQVAQSKVLYARVVSVSGYTVTLDKPAVQTVSRSDVFVGSINMTVRNLTLDGNKLPAGSPTTNPFPLQYRFARYVRIENNTIVRGDHGAISLESGTSDSTIQGNVLMDHGVPAAKLGSAIWLFGGATGNLVRDNTIGGATYLGVMIDDRSETSTEYDAPSDNNAVIHNQIDIPTATGNATVYVAGSDLNEIADNDLASSFDGISITRSTQGIVPEDSERNFVHDNRLKGHWRGFYVTGSSNRIERNALSGVVRAINDFGTANLFTP
jgi:parallel beta-helix repeat protein